MKQLFYRLLSSKILKLSFVLLIFVVFCFAGSVNEN